MAGAPLPTQQARSGATAAAREPGALARLALAEILLNRDDARECAQATVDWLGERGGARRAVCVLIGADSGELEEVVAWGVPRRELEGFGLGVSGPDHPLVFALAASGMIWLLCGWRVRQRKLPQQTPGIIYIALALATVLLIALAGHLGGIVSGVESGAT